MRQILRIGTFALAIVASTAYGRDSQDPLAVDLKFTPQESVHSASADLPANVLAQAVKIVVEDGRQLADKNIVGQGTNDEDKAFAIRATTDPVGFFSDSLQGIVSGFGVKQQEKADRLLTVRLVRLFVDESNKALGSVYAAEVKVSYRLSTGKQVLFDGAASGTAHRYGRARSGANCAEVLSDAVKEAVANMVGDSALQTAWASGQRSTNGQAVAKESAEDRLRKLDDLLKKGLITKPEYDQKRAEILKDM